MAKDTKPAGDAVTKPAYGEKDQPEPIAPNRTDAEGIDSTTQPGAATGEPADLVAARARVAAADAERAKYEDKDGRLPHVLKSGLDVRRTIDGHEQIHRIPAGTVIKETDLTEEEWDFALAQKIVGEATVGELRAHEARESQRETDEATAERRREQVGVKPKKGSASRPPAGSTMVMDLSEAQAAEAQRRAALQTALTANRR